MQTKIEIPGDVLEALIGLYESCTEDDLELFEEEFPEFIGWRAEITDAAPYFDYEKGYATDFEVILTNPEGIKYKTETGHRTRDGYEWRTDTFYLYTPKEKKLLETITLYHNGYDNGDGSATIYWYLTEEEAWEWCELELGYECIGSITSFVGSPEHLKALESHERIKARQ